MKVVEHGVGSILGEEELEAVRRVVSSGDSLKKCWFIRMRGVALCLSSMSE